MVQRSDLIQYGTDSSGRLILMTERMLVAWLCVLNHPLVAPFAHKIVIVQGAWQSFLGGGADASEGVHDTGGALDVRVWNLTDKEITTLIWVMNLLGWPATWLRNAEHGGFDPHIHGVYAGDLDISFGALAQIAAVFAGRDGLASNGPDYHDRPNHMPKTLPKEARMQLIDDMVAAFKKSEIETVDGPLPIGRVLARTYNRVSANQDAAKEISEALAAAGIEADAGVVQKAVETGLRNVLGSLDNKKG